ncbi:MAG: hypothetical protein ACLTK0_09725 [Anaerovoracaceae bacterium]
MANVPINIRNTSIPQDQGLCNRRGQSGRRTGHHNRYRGSKDFTVVALYKNMMSSERRFVEEFSES